MSKTIMHQKVAVAYLEVLLPRRSNHQSVDEQNELELSGLVYRSTLLAGPLTVSTLNTLNLRAALSIDLHRFGSVRRSGFFGVILRLESVPTCTTFQGA